MEIVDFKDINKVKEIVLCITKDIKKEFGKIKNISKENFLKGFNDCFVGYLKNEYTKFDGRVSRCKYWIFAAYSIFIGFIISFLVAIFPFLEVLSILYFLVLLVPSVGLGVRRLHDINFSGWWFAISLIPYIGGVALVFLFMIPGDKKENNFGR